MNNDLISREALKKKIQEIVETEMPIDEKWAMGLRYSLKLIDNAPTVENITVFCENADEKTIEELKAELKRVITELRPQGEWKFDDTEQFCYCSNCEDTYYQRPLDPSWHYCPHCGAKM